MDLGPQLICNQHNTILEYVNHQFVCQCGHTIPTINDIPRFVSADRYTSSFGLQWKTYRKTQLDSYTGLTISRDRLTRLAGGSLEVFRSKNVLEAGCGAGRFTEIILDAGAKVFACDLSSAVEANYANFKGKPRYFVCQADILDLPVSPAQFDVVLCIGVIQHTPDPEQTMSALCTYVKPGGLLFIDHYSYGHPETISRRLLRRFLLTLQPPRLRLAVCKILVSVLWPIHCFLWKMRKSQMGRTALGILLRVSPIVDYHDAYPQLGPELLRAWVMLDTHDSLTDVYKHLRSKEEIASHLRACGMVDIETIYAGNGVEARARKPVN